MPFSEFLEWLEYLRMEEVRDVKTDYYLAQIAMRITQANVKDPAKLKVTDFLLGERTEPELTREQRVANSKAAWGSFLRAPATPKRKGAA